MISDITVGTNDLPRASAFFDSLLGEMGAARVMVMDRMVIWGAKPGAPMLAVCTPYDGKPASAGNGTMVAIDAGSRETVDKLHAKALALGGATKALRDRAATPSTAAISATSTATSSSPVSSVEVPMSTV